MRRFARLGTAVVTAATVVLASTLAFADETPGYVEHAASGEQNVIFKDDPLAAGGLGPNDFRITVPPTAKRVTLLRPRTQFVQEMLKSVENL